ncbi:MAG: hypothetical protein FJ293_14190 [Planctomycetes bacterium]|nr:hypothetical protein [Planctomycetota bacterium]
MNAAHDTGNGTAAIRAWRAGRLRNAAAIALVVLLLPRFLWSWGATSAFDPSPDAPWPARSLLAVEAWPAADLPYDKYPEGWHLVAGMAEHLARAFWLTAAESAHVDAARQQLASEVAAHAGRTDFDPSSRFVTLAAGHETAHWKLVIAGRCATLVLLVLLLAAAGELALAAAGPRFGWVGVVALAAQPAIVHYGTTLNTDVPALAWSALSWALLVAGRTPPDARRVVLAGMALGLAAATKDQFAAMAPGIAWFAWRRGAGRAAGRLPRLGWLALGGALAYVAASGWINGGGGVLPGRTFRDHVAHLFGAGSQPFREHTLSPSGLLGLLDDTGERLLTAAGVIATAGLFLLPLFVVLRRRWRALAWLLPALTYFALFLAPAGYVYPRFTLPLCLSAAIGLAWGLAHAQGARTRQRVVVAALALAFAAAEASQVVDARRADVRPAAVAALAERRAQAAATLPAGAAPELCWVASEPWLHAPFPPIAAPARYATLAELGAAVKRGEPVARWLWLAVDPHGAIGDPGWIATIEKKLRMKLAVAFDPAPRGRLANDPAGILLPKVFLFERAAD